MKLKHVLVFLILAVFLITGRLTIAADGVLDEPLVLEEIVPDTPATAEQMNAILAEVQKIYNQNKITMFDYGTPATIYKKIFQRTASPMTLMSVTYTENMETWQFADGSKVEYLTAPSDNGTLEIGRREYNTSGIMTQDLTYDPPIIGVDLSGPKEVGKIWGGGFVIRKPDNSIYGTGTKMFAILALEDIIVPAGTYLNCVKVHITGVSYNSVAWYAEGIGMIKRIGVDGLFELQSIEEVTP